MSKNIDFFPTSDYKIPQMSNYMKFVEGDNTFRVLSSAIVGWEYWTGDNKPVRSREPLDYIPEDIKMVKNKEGKLLPSNIDHFWAFVVWNYEAKRIQILEIKQKTIMKSIQGYVNNPKWGNPKKYDITINKTGSGFDTEYVTTPNPHSEISDDIVKKYESMNINLELLYSGDDPFKAIKREKTDDEENQRIQDIAEAGRPDGDIAF